MRKSPVITALLLKTAVASAGVTTPARLLRVVRPYDVRHYRLSVRLDPRSGAFETRTAITFQVTSPMSVLELDAVGLKVQGAWLVDDRAPAIDGAPPQKTAPLQVAVRENHADEVQGTVAVTLPLRLSTGSEATVEILSSGVAGKDPSGLFVVKDPERPKRPPLYLTHFLPLGARRLFPCHDDPADKATFDLSVETEARLQVLAGGRRVSDLPRGPGRHQVRYAMARPMSTYHLALAVGSFDQDTLDEGGVPLDVYLSRARKDDGALGLRLAADAMRSLQRFLDVPYPFERYGQVEAPVYPVSALGSSSLTVAARGALVPAAADAQLLRYRTAQIVSRELAHQWFGDLVTMRWWDEAWLNESLASYAAGRYLAERYGAEALQVRTYAELLDSYYRTDQGPRSHPISNGELLNLEDAFDAITYAKGAQVMRMIEELLGEERMAAGLSGYLRQHAFRNATGADLLAALTRAQQGMPAPQRRGAIPAPEVKVAEFARSWLESRGHPIVTAGWRYDGAKQAVVLTLRQRPSHAADDTRWHVRLPVALHRRGEGRYAIEATLVLSGSASASAAGGRAESVFTVPAPAPPEWVSFNRGGLALVEVEVPGVGEAAWAQAAASDPDATSRFMALLRLLRPALQPGGDLGKLTRVAEEAVARALRGDPSPFLRYHLALQLSRGRGALPRGLAAEVIQAAQAPAGIDPADPLAVGLSRAGAVALLGKVPGDEAMQLLSTLAKSPTLPFDLIEPAAAGLARRGDDAAMEALAEAVKVQRERGLAHGSRVLAAYGAIGQARHLREVLRVVRENSGHPGLVSEVLWGLFYNEEVRQSADFPATIAELVLGTPELAEDQQARALMAMEGLRTREARAVLESVSQRAKGARIRRMATLFLSRTFG